MTAPTFMPGQLVEILDAFGKMWPAIADSNIEGTNDPKTGRKVHDFPVVWVKRDGRRIPWPAEDVYAKLDAREQG